MYGLAAHEEKDENSARWMEIAKGITNTCHESFDRSDTKLGKKPDKFENWKKKSQGLAVFGFEILGLKPDISDK